MDLEISCGEKKPLGKSDSIKIRIFSLVLKWRKEGWRWEGLIRVVEECGGGGRRNWRHVVLE